MSEIARAAGAGSRRAWMGVGLPILGLVAAIMLLAVATFASFARDQDDVFERNSETLVVSGLHGRAQAIGATALDYANWDAAFSHITRRWDQDWVESNFYSSVADGMILFRPNGAVRYSWFNDAFAAQAQAAAAAAARASARVPSLRRLGRAPTLGETVAYTYAAMGDDLLLIALVPVTPEDNSARIAYNPLRGYDYVAVIKIYDDAGFARAGHSMSLQDFHFSETEPLEENLVVSPVKAPDGSTVGYLQWRDTHPGAAAFQKRIWPVIVALLIIGALTLLIARHLVGRQIGAMAHAEATLEASRAKAEFLAKVGHELRSPLNGIIGYAEIIQEETDSPIARADADRIIGAARELHHMLNDILDQSRLHAGRIVVKREVLPVVGMLAEVQGLMLPAARMAAVNLTVQPSAAANYVVADHVRLRQCLLNLIGNAIKFAPRGNVVIKTRTEERQDGDVVVFDIVDDGVGVAKADLENLFKPFSHANAQVAESFGGTGLGLSIARDLARAMGGDVTVVSEFGKGSTFSLRVPVATPKALQAA